MTAATTTPEKPALVLHLVSGNEPLLFALDHQDYASLEPKLAQMVQERTVQTIRTKDGSSVTVNFSHVAVAYLDDLQRKNKVFGLH